MVSPNVNKLLQQVLALNETERRELRNLLEERADRQSARTTKQEQLAQVLLDEGIISRIPPKPAQADVERFEAWQPVPIQDKPLSETIIEERH